MRGIQNYILSSIVILPLVLGFAPPQQKKTLEEKIFLACSEIDSKFNLSKEDDILLVDGLSQKLYLIDGFPNIKIEKEYSVSTGENGFGNDYNSGKTPLGIHKICQKMGDGKPYGTIFRHKKSLKKIAKIPSNKKLMTSRILRIKGYENINLHSFDRDIYFHGTPIETMIGKPCSGGCIRMKNKDIIELYELVDTNTYVNILKSL